MHVNLYGRSYSTREFADCLDADSFAELCAHYYLQNAVDSWLGLSERKRNEILKTFSSAKEWIIDTAKMRATQKVAVYRSIVDLADGYAGEARWYTGEMR